MDPVSAVSVRSQNDRVALVALAYGLAVAWSATTNLAGSSYGTSGLALALISSVAGLALLASGAVATGVIAINRPFVAWWVGPTQYGGWLLTAAVVGPVLGEKVSGRQWLGLALGSVQPMILAWVLALSAT